MLALLFLLVPLPAHVFFEPVADCYALRLLAGTVLGRLFAVGLCWRRVSASVKRLSKHGRDDDGS